MSEQFSRPVTIGISTKMYLGYVESCAWLEEVVRVAQASTAVQDGRVELFVAPSFPVLETALRLTRGTPIKVGAQNASDRDTGALTGEVSPAFLAEMGVQLVELGHAERRRHFGEDDGVTAAKVAAAQRNGLTPLLCVGELERTSVEDAAQFCLEQVATAGVGATGPAPVLAYEPVWAIGAAEPAGSGHVRAVVARMKAELPDGVVVIYGGSAGPGLLPRLQPEVDGLFLGRFAHDPRNLERVLAEAVAEFAGFPQR
ncbi:triose-phosphate isomerase family protein [Arthrobacter subterraneus]|uniref:triose-phosphate isomerase family protein n=1 Tax=Arthrobacter subterraneus TaxID=335973 RepID=UPI0037F243EE